jgi:hypothetical protein
LLIKGATKACGGGTRSEATHGVIALFDAAVILLDPIVEILIAAMDDLLP